MNRDLLTGNLIAVAVLFLLELTPLRHTLRYERDAIAAGALWRLGTAHRVHLSVGHTAVNALGLIGVLLLVGDHLRIKAWLLGGDVTAPAMAGAMWLFRPQLDWYVGLSGMLHGLIVAGSIVGLRRHMNVILTSHAAILVIVVLKLG